MRKILLSCAVFLFVTAVANASGLDLNTLNKKLEKEGATWRAKKSWVTDLSAAQVDRLLGYKKKVRIGKDVTFTPKPGLKAFSEESVDWRNHDGQNWVSPILNQGNCGSCVAFAAVGTLETQMNISHQASWLNPHYSTEALFACGGGGCNFGWWPSSAASYLKTHGVPDEACAPYTMGATGRDASCTSICPDADQRSQKITSINEPGNAEAVKTALRHGPLMTTLDVYADFIGYGSGVYRHTTGGYLGGHAVSIVGYNDAERYWIVRNSWGREWGEDGFVRVSYDDTSGIGSETWGFDVPNTEGVAGIKNLTDHQFLSGDVMLKADSTFPGTSSLSVFVKGGPGREMTLSCESAHCDLPLATAQFPDGRYEASLTVKTAKGTVNAEKKYFYVVNKRPEQLAMSFQPKGVDLTKPVTGRPEFDITATSSSVPFTSVDFVAMKDGKVANMRSSDIVLPQMTMGWRTTAVPNGVYDIFLVGKITTGSTEYKVESNHFTITVQN